MSDEMIPTSPSQWDYYQTPYSHHHQTSSEYTLPFQLDLSVSPETVPDIKQTLLRDDQTATSDQIIPSPEIDSSSSSYPRNPSVGESMSPKNGVAKPARRRSRASKKAPTTLLNASLTNFRSLVQQYTGCHSSSSSHSSILRNQRGPITLSFGPPPGSDFQTSGEQAWQHEQEQQQRQGQHLMVSYNHNSFLDTTSFTYSGVDNDNNNNNNGSSKSSNPSTSVLNVDDYDEW